MSPVQDNKPARALVRACVKDTPSQAQPCDTRLSATV